MVTAPATTVLIHNDVTLALPRCSALASFSSLTCTSSRSSEASMRANVCVTANSL